MGSPVLLVVDSLPTLKGTMMDLRMLQGKSTDGLITDEEVEAIAQRLRQWLAQAAISLDDRSEARHMLLVLARSPQGLRYRNIFEAFLKRTDNTNLTAFALQELCSWWGYTEDYLDEVEKFMAGVEYDPLDDIKQTAISIYGRYIANTEQYHLLERLISIFQDPQVEITTRIFTFEAISEVLGYHDGLGIAKDVLLKYRDSSVDNPLGERILMDEPTLLQRIQDAINLAKTSPDSSSTSSL